VLAVPVLLTGCATSSNNGVSPPLRLAQERLREAGARTDDFDERVAAYLDAAAHATVVLKSSPTDPVAIRVYNASTAGLTAALFAGNRERKLDRPIALQGSSSGYELRIAPALRNGIWAADSFNRMKPAADVDQRHARQRVRVHGIGGTLVGVRDNAGPGGAREQFQPAAGITAPVTAIVDFKPAGGRTIAVLTLYDPAEVTTAHVAGRTVPLAADFTAPLAYYPLHNELIAGFLAMIQVEKHLGRTGLYTLQPYDPDRIPVIFVHGLASTPQMWLSTINEIEADPELRGKFQFWAFQYPTGNPMSYSALRFREELEKARQHFGLSRGIVLVGHSMGGLLSKMQATTTGRTIWDANFGTRSERLYRTVPSDSMLKRGLIFGANPQIKRIVFICTPHRGSELALSSIGRLGTSLISIPAAFVKSLETTIGGSVETVLGIKGARIPTSIQSLSPTNPTLKALDALPIEAPHHSIIGDRGRNDTPNSSDGIVPYRSSHLPSAESELVVPGPHGSYDKPQTISELRRILLLHIENSGY
jgi:pimeloyl-ACP methyl ester carboxylesterase